MIKLPDFGKLVAFFTRLSKREKIIFYCTSFVVVTMVTDQLVIRPIARTFHSLNQQGRDLEMSIKKSVRLLAQKERMMKEAEEYAAYSAESKSPEGEAGAFLKHIEELANQSSVNLLYAKPASTQEKEAVKKYYVTLECEGQVEQLVNFFYQIENSKLLLRIEKYALQPTAKESSVIKCAVTISKAVVP